MSQSIRGLTTAEAAIASKGKRTGTPRSRGYAVPKNVEREIDRPSKGRGIGKRSDSNRPQRKSTGARAQHDREVLRGRHTVSATSAARANRNLGLIGKR